MIHKINVVHVVLSLLILAIAVLYYAERNLLDLIYLIILITQFVRYIRQTLI